MRYLSVCSGIEAATVAWHPLGWKPIAFAEIEPFASTVLANRFPTVPNLGNMEEYDAWQIKANEVDLLVGGTPCQSFSVAGLRKGLQDPRGNLALVYLGLLDKYRPRWCVWENVFGVLSSNGGRDFGSFVGGLAELGYGFAYRVLDAQYVRTQQYPFAVPQRRRRVFVVGHSSGDARRAAKVLLEPEGVRGNPPSRSQTQQSASSSASTASGGSGKPAFEWPIEVADPITANEGRTYTHEGANNFRMHNVVPAAPFDISHITNTNNRSNPQSGDSCHAVTLPGRSPTIAANSMIRRLTPLECERLQGFPDNWTGVKYKGRKIADNAHRYRALGNSMAVNVMNWIGARIEQNEQEVECLIKPK